jgi:hypothetical protein
LAQTLTGQSLTGTQATSLVDLAATWNTTGNPSLIYGRVTNTNSGTAANLIDLGTFAGGSLFSVNKGGDIAIPGGRGIGNSNSQFVVGGGNFYPAGILGTTSTLGTTGVPFFGIWLGSSGASSFLTSDAAGILAQRNGVLKQALRVYNTALSTAPEWAEFDWITSGTGNTLKIGTNKSGDGVARPIDFVVGGTRRGGFLTNGRFEASIVSNLSYIGAIINQNDTKFFWEFSSTSEVATFARLQTSPIMQFAGTTSAFPAIKRSTTSLQARLADDSAFTNIQGKLTTDTAYTATVVVPTGFLTLYDSTGTAYRVPCVV